MLKQKNKRVVISKRMGFKPAAFWLNKIRYYLVINGKNRGWNNGNFFACDLCKESDFIAGNGCKAHLAGKYRWTANRDLTEIKRKKILIPDHCIEWIQYV